MPMEMSRQRVLSFIMLLWFFDVELALGQDQEGRYDLLRGTNRETSCQLKDAVHSACNTSTPPPLGVTPTPSVCTCNNIFFNIWSACSYASGNNTLPDFDHWTNTCTNSSVDLSKSDDLKYSSNGLGINIPVWAWLEVPGNTSFDIQRAVVAVHEAPKPWSPIQIALPFLSGLFGCLLTFAFMLLYRKRSTGNQWVVEISNINKLMNHKHRVRTLRTTHGWEIDPEGSRPVNEDYVFVDPASPVIDEYPDTIKGNSLFLASSMSEVSSKRETVIAPPSVTPAAPNGRTLIQPPGGPKTNMFPTLPIYLQSDLTPLRNNNVNIEGAAAAAGSLNPVSSSNSARKRFHLFGNPWKRTPVRVLEKPPKKGFGIEQDLSTISSSSRPATRTYSTVPNDSILESLGEGNDEADSDYQYKYQDFESEAEVEREESSKLISDDQRENSIIVIGKEESPKSEDFTNESTRTSAKSGSFTSGSIHSLIQVITPSQSSSSPRSSFRIPFFGNPTPPPPPLPTIPPPPKKPAPLPPPSLHLRKPARGPSFQSPNPQFATSIRLREMKNVMPPIAEDLRSSPSLSHKSRPSSTDSSRLIRTSSSLPFAPHNSPQHLRSASDSMPNNRSGSPLRRVVNPPHNRAASHEVTSNTLNRSITVPSADSLRPAASSSTAANYNNQASTSAQGYFEAPSVQNHSLSSLSSTELDDMYLDPYSPSAPHRRGPMADDTASFYLTPAPPDGDRAAPSTSYRGPP